MKLMEIGAVLVTLAGIVVGVSAPFVYENALREAALTDVDVIQNLTGVAESGVWTTERVHAGDYWWREFVSAEPRFKEGQRVLLRLHSADVQHQFYSPALGIDPVEVLAGKVSEVTFVAKAAGVYEYFCLTICGHCHYWMKGRILVEDANGHVPGLDVADAKDASGVGGHGGKHTALELGEDAAEVESVKCPAPGGVIPPTEGGLRARGKALYESLGCVSCHGENGSGGVPNFNYAKSTVQAHDNLAEKLFLEESYDMELLIELLEAGKDIQNLKEEPDIPRWRVVQAQYKSIRDAIREGRPSAKADADGPEPPLQMPTNWLDVLSERDVDAIIVHLLSLQKWDDEDMDEEEE